MTEVFPGDDTGSTTSNVTSANYRNANGQVLADAFDSLTFYPSVYRYYCYRRIYEEQSKQQIPDSCQMTPMRNEKMIELLLQVDEEWRTAMQSVVTQINSNRTTEA